jgi:hypothetical protein
MGNRALKTKLLWWVLRETRRLDLAHEVSRDEVKRLMRLRKVRDRLRTDLAS